MSIVGVLGFGLLMIIPAKIVFALYLWFFDDVG